MRKIAYQTESAAVLCFSILVGLLLFLTQPAAVDSAPINAVPPPASFPSVNRIVAIGDVHGDVSALEETLRMAGIIDIKGRWIAGKAHLVQTGDVPDRAPRTRDALDLLMRLEKDAASHGGKVHALLGNHEVMNMIGDLRYVTPDELASYAEFSSVPDPVGTPRGSRGHQVAYSPEGRYGKWLREHNGTVRIGKNLFVHGGISSELPFSDLAELNRWVRIDILDKVGTGGAMNPAGPLWFRGYALDPESTWKEGLSQVLKTYGASRMVMGHTTTRSGQIEMRFRGKAVFVDTGISEGYGHFLAALEIRNDNELTAIYPERRVKLISPHKVTDPIH